MFKTDVTITHLVTSSFILYDSVDTLHNMSYDKGLFILDHFITSSFKLYVDILLIFYIADMILRKGYIGLL